MGPSAGLDATTEFRASDLLPRRLVAIPIELIQLTCKVVTRQNVDLVLASERNSVCQIAAGLATESTKIFVCSRQVKGLSL